MKPITIISFSYRRAVPKDCKVFDCRSIRNPHREKHLRNLTGYDPEVQDYVTEDPTTGDVFFWAMEAVKQGHTNIAFGCFGGRHRSVALAEILAERLKSQGLACTVEHTELALS